MYGRPEDKTEKLKTDVRKALGGAICWTVIGLGGVSYLVKLDGSPLLYILVGPFCVIAWASFLCHVKWLRDYLERKQNEEAMRNRQWPAG